MAISAAEPLTPIAAYILSPLALTIAFQLACSRAANSKMQNTVRVIADRFNSEGHRNVTRARAACQRGLKRTKQAMRYPRFIVHRAKTKPFIKAACAGAWVLRKSNQALEWVITETSSCWPMPRRR